MKFDKVLPIVYPFTTYYYGYISDLGENPVVTAHLFRHEDHAVIDTDCMVDIKEIRQVSNDTLIVGTAYVNREGNNLEPGDYRLLLTLQIPYTQVDLLYAPIELVDLASNFRVSFVNRQNITDDEIRDYMSDIVPAGVKQGFRISLANDTNSLMVSPGTLYTDKGTKIVLDKSVMAPVYVEPTSDHQRTDLVCLYYDENLYDARGNVMPPTIRLVKSVDFSDAGIPVLPDCYVPIAYVVVKAGTNILSASNTTIIPIKYQVNDRPFFNVRSLEDGNGERSLFTFNTYYVPGTSKVSVDGVRQYVDEDYTEVASKPGYSSIQFIGEVPGEGQIVTLSGQTLISPYLDIDRSSYITPRPPDVNMYYFAPDPVEFYRSDLYNMGEGFLQAYNDANNSFKSPTPAQKPISSYSKELGRCVYLREEDSLESLNSSFAVKGKSYVITSDFRDTPNNDNRRRLITIGNIHVDISSNPEHTDFILGSGELDILRMPVDRKFLDVMPSVLAINLFDNNISLHYSINEHREITDTDIISNILSNGTYSCILGRYLDNPGVSYSLYSLSIYDSPVTVSDYTYFKGAR